MSTCDDRGVGYAYYQSMKNHGKKTAQFDVVTKKEQSFEELLQRCIGAALAIEDAGLKPGDFVTTCSLNHLDVCVPYLASLFTGTISASVEATMPAQEMVYLLNQVGPKIIFVGPEAVEVVEEAVEKLDTKPLIVVFGDTGCYPSFSDFIAPFSGENAFRPRIPESLEETALVLFSSGTTGLPKGICHTHRSMLANSEYWIVDDCSTAAWFTTPYWSTFYLNLHMCIRNGLCRVLLPPFDKNNPWSVLEHKIDFLLSNPLQALAFTKQSPRDNVDLGNLFRFTFAGYGLPEAHILELRKKFPKSELVNVYGQSEFFGVPFQFPCDSRGLRLSRKYPTSAGTPKSHISWKIVDLETGKPLGPNQQGELLIKADFQCKGYHNRDSSEVFDSEGYVKTGDIAYYNEEMCFFIVNRIKESFKYQGIHIIPSEIEAVLQSHPSVARVVVVGLPHETDGNHPMGVVVLNDKAGKVCEGELLKFIEDRVEDKNRLRGGVTFVKKLPLTVTEKLNRFKLTQLVLSNQLHLLN
ncbi:hypothetical protein PPYR_14100 [Photinus pyralis]|uniref:AMP-dependent synthetase/ligase domain-containing protein n=1 Tax=Photinus pyralis TaxID=7054 RepID=A0A5N4A4E5_PHOPY|nr:4-coumarate--CoA ligase 1-like [Photinus pyralis]KAB0792139.1 hypothetical protein PPYR_14100 [Photinus pyralis]